MEFVRLRGIAVSPGVAIGRVLVTERIIFSAQRETIPPGRVKAERARLEQAICRTRRQLSLLRSKIRKKAGEDHAFIFDAHLMILEDHSLRSSLDRIIAAEKVKAEWALSQVNAKYRKIFESLNDDTFRQRQLDVTDVLARVYRNLKQKKEARMAGREVILAAHDLLPSEAAGRLSRGNILGVALDGGGADLPCRYPGPLPQHPYRGRPARCH